MTISYNWLSEYLPVIIDPDRLSRILTSIGLEVEHLEPFESVKGGLKGLIVGEVLTCEQHPNADKLKITTVNTGEGQPLQIVCGASNVAAGQKVVVAKAGVTIYPVNGEHMTMKIAKIRGTESQGMICAEDEIGIGTSHEGIIVLPSSARIGTAVKDMFHYYDDFIYEIGLTPNRMDAMSHLGVARDVCAYLTHHDKKDFRAKTPSVNAFKSNGSADPISVSIENKNDCQRYSGVSISGVKIDKSPTWLQDRLKAIGLRPINNIVDVTNFILHETGQPLHAFDADAIAGKKVIIKNLPQGTPFLTLDSKERILSAQDLMICDSEKPICIAGVFGGLNSGVNDNTSNIFLESAWFQPTSVRRTSLRHGLRTDAATRFEKGVDISNTVNVLKRAALLITEIAGGKVSSDITDVYPDPKQKTEVAVKYHYVKKLSGKNYHPGSIKKILEALGFEITKDGIDQFCVAVPFSKPDISLPADIVEEIIRIDGLDNIDIPSTISISPSVSGNMLQESLKQKIASYLVGAGFNEILTNSITNGAYFSEAVLATTVKMLNSLSTELNVMRPTMLPTALETIAFNLNRKSNDLRLFEFGKTYSSKKAGVYLEQQHLCVYTSGNEAAAGWKNKVTKTDLYALKGMGKNLVRQCGITPDSFVPYADEEMDGLLGSINGEWLVKIGTVHSKLAEKFDIRQPVYCCDINWTSVLSNSKSAAVIFRELPKQLPVYRDLALVVDKSLPFQAVEKTVKTTRLEKLQAVNLFDVFESEKLGKDKKSFAVSFTFLDEEKTMTDTEIDGMMNKLMRSLEKELNAEIRK